MKLALALVLAVGCAHDAAPPPPAPTVEPIGVPHEIAAFVHAHERDTGSWDVSLVDNQRTTHLSQTASADLVALLMKPTSYVSGEYGCASEPVHVEIRRGHALLPLDVNCAYLFLSPRHMQGPWVTMASDLTTRIALLRSTVLP